MSASTTVLEVLRAMFRHRYRRVFLDGEQAYVSDRSIMSYLFSPMVLEDLGREGQVKDILSTPISKTTRTTPLAIGPKMGVKTVALKLMKDRGGCLVTSDGKVVTPWDTVMKPWMAGKLVIR